MKHIKHWLATMAMLLCCVAANAEDFEVGGIYYRISSESDRTVVVTFSYPFGGYSGKHVEIPSSVMHNGTTYRVTGIDLMTFYGCSDIKSITLPNSITELVATTFDGCTGELIVNCDIPDGEVSGGGIFIGSEFTKVTIGKDVRNIGNNAFGGCSSIISLTIQDGVTNIGNTAFAGCSNINSLTLPQSVTSIGHSAFSGCCSLTSTYIPNSVTNIGEDAFWECTGKLTINCNIPDAEAYNPTAELYNAGAFYNTEFSEIIIGEEVEYIGKYAFYDCESLISVDFHKGVRNIGESAFGQCENLNAIIIPNSVISIGDNAFEDCVRTTSVVIPNSVANIGERAFANCAGELFVNCNIPSADSEDTAVFSDSQFSKVTIGDDVTSIGDNAFKGCVSINSLELSQHITSIGDYAFSNCSNIKTITIPENVNLLGTQAFAYCGGKLVVNCDIPSAAASSQGAFYSGLFTEVIIGDKVKSIGDYAFESCYSLKSLTLSNSLETIGDYAFYLCSNIVTLTFSEGLTSIGDYAFYCCTSLNSLTIPESVASIGDYAFYCCTLLAKITCHSTIPPTCGVNTFTGVSPYYTSLEIPLGSEVLYRSAEGWKNLFTNVGGGGNVVAVTGITLSQTEATLVEGETLTLTATVLPSDATDNTVTWSSSKESVATVTNGVVTAKSVGVAIITAKVSDKEATCVVTVEKDVVAVTNITLSQTEATITEGESLTLIATISPNDATDKTITWSSSKESVATVEDGVVTAIAPGVAIITAKAGDKEATCVVIVEKKVIAVTNITLSQTEATMTEGEILTLTASVSPSNATDKTVTWSTSNNSVATVKNGKVTAKAVGTAVITAKAGDKEATCVVIVEKKVIAVTNITLSQTEATMTEGEILTLTASVSPSNATDKTVTWSTSDVTVATVDANGKVTAVAAGTATITAAAGDKTAVCVVTVTKKEDEDAGIEPSTLNSQLSTLIYDLSGRRVLSTENLKGLYIVNGKKVIFK